MIPRFMNKEFDVLHTAKYGSFLVDTQQNYHDSARPHIDAEVVHTEHKEVEKVLWYFMD